MNVNCVPQLVLSLAFVSAISAVHADYDSTWYRAPFWSGEYPNGFTVLSPTTVWVRAEPTLSASASLKCDLAEGANYHPWNTERVKKDNLEFVSFTRIIEMALKKRFRAVVLKDHPDNSEVTLDFASGEKWRYLAYIGEGAFLMEYKGAIYVADQDLFENSDETGKKAETDSYHEWLKLQCANAVVGWLLMRDLEGIASLGGPSFDKYQEASDEKPASENLKLNQKQRWVQLFSSKDVNEAVGVAKLYGRQSARVVRADNGWLGVVYGPVDATTSVDEIRARGDLWPALPGDALLSSGSSYIETVWKPSEAEPLLAKGELEYDGRLRLAAGKLNVDFRGSGGELPYVTIEGFVDDRSLFRLQTPDLPVSGYGNIDLEVIKLDAEAEYPQIVVRVFSGGAHCCTSHWIVSEGSDGNWRLTEGETLDGGGYWYEDADGDGTIELLSADNSFLYTFEGYAGSFPPTRILRFSESKLTEVSDAPGFVDFFRQEAAGSEFLARENPDLWRSNGFLAGWIASRARTGDILSAWEKMLDSFDPASTFGVSVCPDPLDDNCESDMRRMLPFPVGLAVHLEQNGYGPLPAALSDFVPAWARQQVKTTPRLSAETRPPDSKPKPSGTSGSGFFVASGRLVTNYHVVAECEELSVLQGDKVGSGAILARDKENDLALVLADIGDDLAILRTGVRLGEDVSVFGFPLVGLLSSGGNFTRGNVTASAGLGDDTRYVQISAPVQPGNSGGPLLDESGNVVGMVTAKIDALLVAATTKDIPQNVNFALKSSTVLAFLESHGVEIQLGELGTPLVPADIADKAQSFTARIECIVPQ